MCEKTLVWRVKGHCKLDSWCPLYIVEESDLEQMFNSIRVSTFNSTLSLGHIIYFLFRFLRIRCQDCCFLHAYSFHFFIVDTKALFLFAISISFYVGFCNVNASRSVSFGHINFYIQWFLHFWYRHHCFQEPYSFLFMLVFTNSV